MSEDAKLETLRRANACFTRFFHRFSAAPVLGGKEEVEALLQVEAILDSVGQLLDGRLQNAQDHSVREELANYQQNLVRLRRQLAGMQQSALACQAHLDSRQKHLHAVKAWCAVARDTN